MAAIADAAAERWRATGLSEAQIIDTPFAFDGQVKSCRWEAEVEVIWRGEAQRFAYRSKPLFSTVYAWRAVVYEPGGKEGALALDEVLRGLLDVLHYADHAETNVRDAQAHLSLWWNRATASGGGMALDPPHAEGVTHAYKVAPLPGTSPVRISEFLANRVWPS